MKLLAVLCAFIMMASGLPALAEENMDVAPDAEVGEENEPVQLTLEEYMNNIDEVLKKLESTVDKKLYESYWEDVRGWLYTGYYYINYINCRSIRQELVDNGLISENLRDTSVDATMALFDLSWLNKDTLSMGLGKEKLFDISNLVIDPETSEYVHKVFGNWVTTYEKGTLDCDEYRELTEQLSKMEKKYYFSGYIGIRQLMDSLYEHCILATFDQKEIKEYLTLKGNVISGVNKRKYKDQYDLHKKLNSKKKKERSELEQYIVLWLNSNGSYSEYRDYAVSKIETDYREWKKTQAK